MIQITEFSRTPDMNPVPENRVKKNQTHQEFSKAKTSLLFHCWANQNECIYMDSLAFVKADLFQYSRM